MPPTSGASARPSGWRPTATLTRSRRPRRRSSRGQVAAAGAESVAVVLLHSYRHPSHERVLGEALRATRPACHVQLSHEVVGTFREFERAATTEVDAAMSPLLADTWAAARPLRGGGAARAGDDAVERRAGRADRPPGTLP